MKTIHPNLEAFRRNLAGKTGREYWRSLEDLADSEEFQRLVEDEFPHRSPEWLKTPNRREALRVMGASLALAGITACATRPKETIVPYVHQPDEVVPGRALFFATAVPMSGFGTGVLVESHEGHPTKVEGNSLHPSSLGATDAFMQASVLNLYDPDRSQSVMYRGRITSYLKFLVAVANVRETQRSRKGAGLHFLLEPSTSPTLADLITQLAALYPAAKWHVWDPASADAEYQATRAIYSRPAHTTYNIGAADVIVALDSDFLASGPGCLRYAREFAARRGGASGFANMNRLYVVEPMMTPTGTASDHRIPIRAADVEPFARALAKAAGTGGAADLPSRLSSYQHHIDTIARDLQSHRGRCLVIAGAYQSAAVHGLAHALNQALGNLGSTVLLTGPPQVLPADSGESIGGLAAAMRTGQVETLVICGANPVYTAPSDLEFASLMNQVPLRIHLGQYQDETAQLCHWHIPETHYLETWNDIRGHDGTITIMQPLIDPLYDSRSLNEFLIAFTDVPDRRAYEIVRQYWIGRKPGADFENFWRAAVHDGVVPDTALPRITPGLNAAAIPPPASSANAEPSNLELVFRPDPAVWDGRFNNNAWLQEWPKPVTKLTWDNAAFLSPATADRLGLVEMQVAELTFRGRTVRAPVMLSPGHAANSITVHLGYGRWGAGRVGNHTGFNAYALRTWRRPAFGDGLEVRKTGDQFPLAKTQRHHLMEGRDIVRHGTLAEYQRNQNFAEGSREPKSSLLPAYGYTGYRWAMVIDQNVCTGCSACVVACQAENNISVVGKEQVLREREMHWIRIDTYYSGPPESPAPFNQPMLCQQCEKAPCEPVCPVAATNHSSEGLNQMVYNRCVGTRYCSNNCPYKVRRFNFLRYADWDTKSLYGVRNPEVTVRSRGVMEKCTFCVQRIQAAKIRAEIENRRVRDGEIVPACAAACPTRAIVFGDLNDKGSQVAKLHPSPLNYAVLDELDTQPRIMYTTIVRNPNPEAQTA